MFNLVFWVSLSVFLILYGITAVTNVRVEWAGTIIGFSAVVAGVAALAKVVRGNTK